VDEQGMVLVVDHSYRPAIVATNNDGITMPDGILWYRGGLVVADEGGRALRWWNNGHVETLCDSSLGIHEPEDIVADGDGNLFFTDDNVGGLWEVERDGHVRLVAGRNKGLFSTEGIALAPSGDILVGDGVRHQVFSVSRDGKVTQFLDASHGITKPESMVYGEKGTLYIADNQDDILYRLTPAMKLERVLDDREGFSPETIWYAGNVLYITDSKHGKLSRFTPASGLETIAAFAGSLHNVCGVTTDNLGHIYVSIQDHNEDNGYVVEIKRISAKNALSLATGKN
jgi:sugar lactone lactonase YvrE